MPLISSLTFTPLNEAVGLSPPLLNPLGPPQVTARFMLRNAEIKGLFAAAGPAPGLVLRKELLTWIDGHKEDSTPDERSNELASIIECYVQAYFRATMIPVFAHLDTTYNLHGHATAPFFGPALPPPIP